jgi:signal transduction histidine kinase
VYWITAESLRNAFRHAQAQNIDVKIRYEEQLFRVDVQDPRDYPDTSVAAMS